MRIHEPNRNPIAIPQSHRPNNRSRRDVVPVLPRRRQQYFVITALLVSLAVNIAMVFAYFDLRSSFDGLTDDFLNKHAELRATESQLRERDDDILMLQERLGHVEKELSEADSELKKQKQQTQQSLKENQGCVEQLEASKTLADSYRSQLRSMQETHFRSLVSNAELIVNDPTLARQTLLSASSFAKQHELDSTAADDVLASLPHPSDIPQGVSLKVLQTRHEEYPITVDVEILTADGRFLPNLHRGDFELMASDRRLHMVSVGTSSRNDQSHTIMLVLDTSGSTKGEPHEIMKMAAVDFATTIANPSRLRVYQFSDTVSAITPLCRDSEILAAAIRALNCSGGTALYRGIRVASEDLRPATGERAIVVFTDGNDSFDDEDLDGILNECASDSIRIHVVTLATDELNDAVLREISQRTGGMYLSTPEPDKLAEQFHTVAASFQRPVYRISILEPVAPEQLSLKLGTLPPVKLIASHEG